MMPARVPARCAAFLFALFALATAAGAQEPTVDTPVGPRVYHLVGSRMAVGRNVVIAADEEVRNGVVVVGGSLRVDGRVNDGIVVVGGDITFGPTAETRGDVVLVGGALSRAESARIRGTISDVRFGDWPTFRVHPGAWGHMSAAGHWLLLGASVSRVALLALLMGLVVLLAWAPVSRVGRAAAAAPGQAFLIGFAAEVMFLPALLMSCVLLAITFVGLPLIPLLVPAVVILGAAALLLGFTALATRLGEWLGRRLGWEAISPYAAALLGLFAVVTPTLLGRALGVTIDADGLLPLALLVIGGATEFLLWTIGLGATMMSRFGRTEGVPPLPAVS